MFSSIIGNVSVEQFLAEVKMRNEVLSEGARMVINGVYGEIIGVRAGGNDCRLIDLNHLPDYIRYDIERLRAHKVEYVGGKWLLYKANGMFSEGTHLIWERDVKPDRTWLVTALASDASPRWRDVVIAKSAEDAAKISVMMDHTGGGTEYKYAVLEIGQSEPAAYCIKTRCDYSVGDVYYNYDIVPIDGSDEQKGCETFHSEKAAEMRKKQLDREELNRWNRRAH